MPVVGKKLTLILFNLQPAHLKIGRKAKSISFRDAFLIIGFGLKNGLKEFKTTTLEN